MISKQRKGPRFLVIGAGSRGSAYARAVNVATNGSIVAVAEPDLFKRREFSRKFITSSDEETEATKKEFSGWQEWLDWELDQRANGHGSSVEGAFICTLDPTHVGIIQALAPLGLHILCEKPLALSLKDCLAIQACLKPRDGLNGTQTAEKVFSIGHVLRYSPHNTLLRRLLLQDRVIGSVVSLEHTEPIGWWHFSHSYVRGNWRKATPEGVGSLLTKSCHDIDFIMWLLCSPASSYGTDELPHLPSTISSSGHLTHFKKARKPPKAGNATNCLSCAAEPECNFSAKKIYRDRWLRKERDTGWPLKIVLPEIEDLVETSGWDAAEDALLRKLGEDHDATTTTTTTTDTPHFGRCVYECDNDVVDTQTVTITWDEEPDNTDPHRGPKTALFNMTYPTQSQCERRGRIYGTLGEITYDSHSISVYSFADDRVVTHEVPEQSAEEMKSHGGGDYGLARGFVEAVEAVERGGGGGMGVEEAQGRFVGCTLEEVVRSHAVVFAAEEARREGKVVGWRGWWEGEVRKSGLPVD